MPNVKAPIKGIPGSAIVDLVLRYPLQQIGAQGLPAAEYRLRSTDGGATYTDLATNATPDIPASGESDPYPTTPVEIELSVATGGRTRTSTMYALPVLIGGVFDLTQPLTPVGWVAPASLTALIASLEDAAVDVDTARASAQQAAADAQTATTAAQGAAAQAAQAAASLSGLSLIEVDGDSVTLSALSPASITFGTETLTVNGVQFLIGVANITTGGTA